MLSGTLGWPSAGMADDIEHKSANEIRDGEPGMKNA
jgi:hypothetical protein